MTALNCPYCNHNAEGEVVWQGRDCRVLLIKSSPFAGLCRVAWNEHVKEFSDLSSAERSHLMAVVNAVESFIRTRLNPAKINLAALGTQVPHLHWHVVPRYVDDSHYPDPIWAEALREASPRSLSADFAETLSRYLDEELAGQYDNVKS